MPRRVRPMALAPLVLVQCVLEPVDFTDHPCPCAAGFVCDPCSNRCVDEIPGSGDGGVRISNFRGCFTTPDRIFWTFVPNAVSGATLAGYELHVAETRELLENGTPSCADEVPAGPVRCYAEPANPELGRMVLPLHTGDVEVVKKTISFGLRPDTPYVARLVAIDSAGRRYASNVGEARTDVGEEDGFVELVADEERGYTMPPSECYGWRMDGLGYMDSAGYYERVHVCTNDPDHSCEAEPMAQCFVNLDTQGLARDLSALEPGDFPRAYLELALYVDDGEPSAPLYWAQAGIVLGGGSLPLYYALTVPTNRGWSVHRVPLRAMETNGRFLTHADIAGRTLEGYRFGATFESGATIRIDSVSVRW